MDTHCPDWMKVVNQKSSMRRHPQFLLSPQEFRKDKIQKTLKENIGGFLIGDKFLPEKDAKELFNTILKNSGRESHQRMSARILLS